MTTPDSTERKPGRNDSVATWVAIALIVAPLGQINLPWGLGSWPNVAILIATLALLFIGRPTLAPKGQERFIPALGLVFLLWCLIVSTTSPNASISFRYCLRTFLYAAFAYALSRAPAKPQEQLRVERVILFFLLGLALFGLLESFLPRHAIFLALRTPFSLSIQPRIASLLSSPNILGALMVVGVALTESLHASHRLSRRAALACHGLFIVLMAQSGSRNAWMVFCVTLGLLWVNQVTKATRAFFLTCAFVLCVLFLPVARIQTSLLNAKTLPVIVPTRSPVESPPRSLAEPLQSLSLRGQVWRSGTYAWLERPTFGIGLGVFSTQIAPTLPYNRRNQNVHSLPLHVLVETGWPGLLLAGALITAIARAGARSAARVPFLSALVVQLFDDFLYDPSFTLVALSLAALCSRGSKAPS